MKKITGTFLDEITWDIPAHNWGKAQWRVEFDTMKRAGIDTVIIIRANLRDMAVYPSKVLGVADVPDLAQLFLDEAHRCGMKLYFGSHETDMTHEWKDWRQAWDLCQRFLPEVKQRYGDHPAFHGWYIAPETCIATEGSMEIYTRYSAFMKELDPGKPVLISPYYPSLAYKTDTVDDRHKKFVDDWHRIFSSAAGVDYVAFQDTTCSGDPERWPTLELDRYVREVHALCKDHGKVQWNNVESFARNMPIKFPPIDWRLLERKMRIADPFCEKHITFEFSHFLSPNSIWPSARNLYERYCEFVAKPE